MRSRFPEFLVILLLPVLLVGCAGFLPGSSAQPTPVFLQPTPVPAHPFVPGVHRYVEAGDRLIIPSPTPRPTLTPWASPMPGFSGDVSQSGDGAVEVAEPGDEIRSCNSHYRQMLIDYRGRVRFGTHVALLLSRELRDLRPDCVEQGWEPRFEADLVCVSGRVAGIRISDALTWLPHSLAPPVALPTARDGPGETYWSTLPGCHSSMSAVAGTTVPPVMPGPGWSPALALGLTARNFRPAITGYGSCFPPLPGRTSARSTLPGLWMRSGCNCRTGAVLPSGIYFPPRVPTRTAGWRETRD